MRGPSLHEKSCVRFMRHPILCLWQGLTVTVWQGGGKEQDKARNCFQNNFPACGLEPWVPQRCLSPWRLSPVK